MRQKINEIIAKQYNDSHVLPLAKERLTEGARLVADIGFDSLDTMEIIANCENTFGVVFAEKQLRHIRTVGDIYKLFEGR